MTEHNLQTIGETLSDIRKCLIALLACHDVIIDPENQSFAFLLRGQQTPLSINLSHGKSIK